MIRCFDRDSGTVPPNDPPPSPTSSSPKSTSTSGETKVILAVALSIASIVVLVLAGVLFHVWQRRKRIERARFAVDAFRAAFPETDKEATEAPSSTAPQIQPSASVSSLGVPYLSKSPYLHPAVASEANVERVAAMMGAPEVDSRLARNGNVMIPMGASRASDAPRAGPSHRGPVIAEEDLATVPALVAQLNRVLARVEVQPDISGPDDPPPEYSTRI